MTKLTDPKRATASSRTTAGPSDGSAADPAGMARPVKDADGEPRQSGDDEGRTAPPVVQCLDIRTTDQYSRPVTPHQVKDLVFQAQRRTATRAEAHRLLCRQIEEMGLPLEEETALRDAAYRQLFPEHASRLACDDSRQESAGDDCEDDGRQEHRDIGDRLAQGGRCYA